MQFEVVSYTHPEVSALVEQAQRFYVERYGEPDQTPVDPTQFDPPDGLFLLVRDQQRAVACGGWRRGTLDGAAELKRMFVVPELRGKGFARSLLAALERTASEAGLERMVLETGTMQPEAISLYRSCGYAEIEPFGHYRCEPESRCYAKHLEGADQAHGDLCAR